MLKRIISCHQHIDRPWRLKLSSCKPWGGDSGSHWIVKYQWNAQSLKGLRKCWLCLCLRRHQRKCPRSWTACWSPWTRSATSPWNWTTACTRCPNISTTARRAWWLQWGTRSEISCTRHKMMRFVSWELEVVFLKAPCCCTRKREKWDYRSAEFWVLLFKRKHVEDVKNKV